MNTQILSEKYSNLKKYAAFLLEHHLHDFTLENISLAKEFALPANKVIFSWKEEEYYSFIKWRTEIFLSFFKQEDPLAPALDELNKWKNDTMPHVGGRVLRIEDLTGSYIIRKIVLSTLLPLYTQDIDQIQKIQIEFAYFYYYWEKEAFQVLFELENIRLLSEIEERTKELSVANRQLQRINSDLDNFIYTASHDLKAPVLNIEGLINALHEELKEKQTLDEDLSHMILLVNNALQRFQNTIRELTEISKIQRDLNEDITEIDVPEMVEEVKLMINSLIKDSKADIRLLTIHPPKLKFSRTNFRSILFVLLTNAIKYRSEERTPIIQVSFLSSDDDFLVLSVCDNGLGIKQQYLPKIFQMFKRVHTHVDGTGVGLYLVKRIVENAGGKVEVESRENEGTTFKLYFLQKEV